MENEKLKNEKLKLKKQTLKKQGELDEGQIATGNLDIEMAVVRGENTDGGSSRRSSISSCAGSTYAEKISQKGNKKRKVVNDNEDESDDNMDEENNYMTYLNSENEMEFITKQRQELEKFIFNETNKISRPAIKFILGIWADMETKVTQLLIDQSKLKGILAEKTINKAKGNTDKATYAGAVKKRKTKYEIKTKKKNNKAENIIIIKNVNDKEQLTNEALKEKALNVLKDKRNEIRINTTRTTRETGLLLETESKEDADVIKTLNFKNAGLKIVTPRKVGPCLIIYDVDKNKTKEEIRDYLWNKNLARAGLNRTEYDDKILFRFSAKNRDPTLVNWIIEVPPDVYDIMLDKGRIFIEWKSHRVKEFYNISRCFKCLGYGHTSKSCSSEHSYCGHCGEKGHLFKECKRKNEEAKCVCCMRNRRKNINHGSRDRNCPEYIRQLERYTSRITYIQWR